MTFFTETIDFNLQPTGHELEVVHDECLDHDPLTKRPHNAEERERFRWAECYSYGLRPCTRCGRLVM